MNDSRWRLQHLVRNCYLTLGLLPAIVIVSAVATLGQENSLSSEGWSELQVEPEIIEGTTEQVNVKTWERPMVDWQESTCRKFLGAPASDLFIQNYLPTGLIVAVIPSGTYPGVLSATIAPIALDPKLPNMPGFVNLCIPARDNEIVVNTGIGSTREKFHIKALPSRSYRVDVTAVLASSMSGHEPGPSSQDSIRSQIDRIANGAHQDLPVPTQTSTARGQNPGWSIENATGYQLHLYLSGPSERDYVIPNGNSISIDLPPGTYRIAADVSNKSVIPFYAVRQLDSNARWTSHFYIGRR